MLYHFTEVAKWEEQCPLCWNFPLFFSHLTNRYTLHPLQHKGYNFPFF